MLLDVRAASLDIFAHEHGEERVGVAGALEGHAHQRAARLIHRGFPQLNRLHFAQALEALDLNASATDFEQRADDSRHARSFDNARVLLARGLVAIGVGRLLLAGLRGIARVALCTILGARA